MRLVFIILIIATSATFGQSGNGPRCEKALDSLTNREIYSIVDTPATINGGLHQLYSELLKVRVPKDPDIDQINLLISFVVEVNGDITDLKTVGRVSSATLNNELLAVFRKFKWEPGRCSGKNVPTRSVLSIKS